MSRRRLKLVVALVLLAAGVGVGAYLALAPDADLKAADAAVARRDFRKAAEHLDRYLQRRPNDPERRLLAARTARRGGDFAAAAAHLRALSQRPGTDPALVLENRLLAAQKGDFVEIKGLMSAHAEQDRGAEAALVAEAAAIGVLQMLDPNPGPKSPLERDAAPLLSTGRRAAEVWLESRTGREDRAAGLVWRGRLRHLGGDHPGAVADLREALQIDPRSFDARFHLALAIAHSAPQEAIAHLALLRDRRPDDPRVRFGVATAYRATGRLDEAAAILDEMLADKPDDVSALVERGSVAVDAGRAAEAEPFLLRAEKLAPKDPQIPLALSRCMQLAGRADKVKEYLDRFRQLDVEEKRPAPAMAPKS